MLRREDSPDRFAGMPLPPLNLQRIEHERLARVWGSMPVSSLFHVHTDKSDGPPLTILAERSRICGFEAVFLADHNLTTDQLASLKETAAEIEGVAFEFGVEITLAGGPHLVVYEFESAFTEIPPVLAPLEEVAEWALARNHLIQIPHPKPWLGLCHNEIEKLLRIVKEKGKVVLAAARSASMPEEDLSVFLPPASHPASQLVRQIYETDAHGLSVIPICGVHMRAECATEDIGGVFAVSTKKILRTLIRGREGEDGDYVNMIARRGDMHSGRL